AGARVLARRVTLAVAVSAVFAVAAWLLWRSSLPAYHLPHLDERALFPSHALHRAQSYSGVERLFWLGKTVTQLLVLGVFARYGARWMRESAAGPIGTGMLLGMIGFALVWVAQLPFAVLAVWWRHRYGLSGSYVQVTIGNWLSPGVPVALPCLPPPLGSGPTSRTTTSGSRSAGTRCSRSRLRTFFRSPPGGVEGWGYRRQFRS